MRLSNKQVAALTKVGMLMGMMVVTMAAAVDTHVVPVSYIEQARAQAGAPDPHIDYIYLNGNSASSTTITQGDSVNIKVQATNLGTGTGYRAAIYMSLPEFDSYADANYVDPGDYSDDLVYHEFRPGDSGDKIWYACGSGYLGAPQVLLIKGQEPSPSWEPGETNYLEVKVTPPGPGTYQVYVKAAMSDSEDSYDFDPTSGAYTDQQCQPVYRRTIEVEAYPNAIYLPVVLRDYVPPVPVVPITVRGVRMQAASCSTESKCKRRLDCLQTAGVTALYYAIYSNEAYYHSDLLPHRSFDSLAYLVPEAHARDMEVYALIASAKIGWPEHPEWNARLNHPNVTEDWLDFTLPEARHFVADVAEEIVTNYDVDGILLDYTRWGGSWIKKANLSADEISETVRGVYEQVKTVRQVAVTASPSADHDFAVEWWGQRWHDWLDDGYVDYVTPMTYVDDSWLHKLLDEWTATNHFPGRIIPRLSVCWFNPTRQKSAEEVLRQIEICYDAGATGVALWDDRYLCKDSDLVEALGAGGW